MQARKGIRLSLSHSELIKIVIITIIGMEVTTTVTEVIIITTITTAGSLTT